MNVEKADRTGRCVFDVPAVRNIDWRVFDVFIKLRAYSCSATAQLCVGSVRRLSYHELINPARGMYLTCQ
jgi:hypothetical protein